MEPRIIFLIGPPGSGKTTQALYLQQNTKFNHIEVSHLIRDILTDEKKVGASEILKEEKRKYNSGELNSSEWIISMIEKELYKLSETNKDVAFSGFPRTLQEAKDLIAFMEKNFSVGVFKVIYLTISKEESINRNSSRKVCIAQGHPIPPEFIKSEKCPWDGSGFTKRDIDSPKIIEERFRVYLEETLPILSFLKNNSPDIIEELDGERSINKIQKNILSVIGND